MAPIELKELKTQLDELLQNGFISQVFHLREPQCCLWRKRMECI